MQQLVNIVYQGDALQVLPLLPSDLVDLVFLDPPYFLQLPPKRLRRWKVKTLVEGVNEDWDKFKDFNHYDTFISTVLQELKRIMKPTATIWVIGTYHNIHRIGKIMQDLGFWILNDVIWVKTNPMPNWLGVRFTNATEVLIWAARDKGAKGYTFNYQFAKQYAPAGFKLPINLWEIPICSGKERLRDESGRKVHSTQKPISLLERIILISTKEGDLVLDPMAGTGTTGVAASMHKRHFILIEKEEKYIKVCKERLLPFGLGGVVIYEPSSQR